MSYQFFSKNCDIRPISEAVVSVEDIEYAYGFGVYETIRVSNGVVHFIDDHLERLMDSAAIISLKHPFTPEMIKKAIRELVAETEEKAFNIKILLIGSAKKENANLYILCFNPLFPDKKVYREGVALAVAHYERAYPHAKSLNMLQSYMAFRDARANGRYDALLIDRNGFITEGTRTNFFTIRNRVIYTPREEHILLGVTRKNVLSVARQHEFAIEEADIRLEDLGKYDGAFITSTSSKIIPVKRAGDFEYPTIAPSIFELITLFGEFLEERSL